MHPFEVTFGLGDIRLTTRYSEDELSSLFTAMHETGHGIYEWGVSKTLERTPRSRRLRDVARVAEPPVGERRRPLPPFWRWFSSPRAGDVPGPAGRRPARELPSGDQPRSAVAHPRRRRRDELRPPRDPPLRARAGASGRLAVADLPEAWNTRFEELMGIAVPNDAVGVLQDAHWSGRASGTSRPTSSARCSRSRSGSGHVLRSRTSRSGSSGASSQSCTRGCARTSMCSAAS